MPLIKTPAVVLRTWKIGDTSRLVALYTRDQGKVKVVAKGARGAKSRTGAALNLFVECAVVYSFKEGRDLHTLARCELVREHRGFERDPMRFGYAGVAAEIVDRAAVSEEPHGELFDLLRETLARMDEAPRDGVRAALWYFALQLAAILGYLPRLDACVVCGGPPRGSGRFGLAEGGLFCPGCAEGRGRAITLSSGALEILRALAAEDWESAERLRPPRDQAAEVSGTLLAFLQAQVLGPRDLRSVGYLRSLRQQSREFAP